MTLTNDVPYPGGSQHFEVAFHERVTVTAPASPPRYELSWDYDDVTNVLFVIVRSDDMKAWRTEAVLPASARCYDLENATAFYQVGAQWKDEPRKGIE